MNPATSQLDLPPSASAPVPVRPVRVLVVDDSAFVRKVVREMLAAAPLIEVVGVARDGEEALQLVEQLQPDVVTCDLLMPRLDGAGFVRAQMARRPLPILILTSSPTDAEKVLDTLASGAVDLVQKPTALATEQLLDIGQELITKVRAAARVPVARLKPEEGGAPEAAASRPMPHVAAPGGRGYDILAIGVSTGGPQALRLLLSQLPANLPVPIVIVLHMPTGYTALFAEKLNEISPLEVVEARQDLALRPGLVVLAQAGRHLTLRETGAGQVACHLSMQPMEKIHRPSVDVLFQSVARVFRERTLALVLTGMGDDGKEGAAWIKAQGGTVLTESEKSCIIYGMPRSVAEAGLSDAAIPLPQIAQTLIQKL